MSFTSTNSWCVNIIITLACVFAALNTRAQIQQVARFEVDITDNAASFEVIPAYEHGVFLHRRLVGPKIEQLEFIRLDSTLTKTWHGFLTIEKGLLMVGQT